MKKLTKYVVGFLIQKDKSYVALIEKARPVWQKGRFNGVGGHIEKGEIPLDAMRREFKEETDLVVRNWRHFATLKHYSRGGLIYFFVALSDDIYKAITVTDEPIRIFHVDSLPEKVMPNLRWLIPMALDKKLTEPLEIIDRGNN